MTDFCEILDWDTSFFGFRIARIRGDTLTEERVAHVDAWCRQNGVRCLYFLSRSDDADTTRAAEAGCFELVDIRMTFAYKVAEPPTAQGHPHTPGIVRASCRGDIPILRSIARGIYHDSRFYYDSHFPRHLCDALYETWIARSCEGYADVVLVAVLNDNPIGYVSCHLDDRRGSGRIGLVGVTSGAQGRGIGPALIFGAFEWFQKRGAEEIRVVTQGRNCAAQRLYQRCGFLTQAIQLWYHKWYSPFDVKDE